MPLSSHNQPQLSEFKQDLSREVKIHLALQNRYDTLLQDKELTEQEIDNEFAATEEVKDMHRDLLRQIKTLKTRHSHYQDGFILQNEFDNFVEVRDPDVPEFEKEVAMVQKRLNLYLQQTISFTEDKELAPLRNKVQSQLSQISKDLAKSRKKHTEDRKKSSESDKDKGE